MLHVNAGTYWLWTIVDSEENVIEIHLVIEMCVQREQISRGVAGAKEILSSDLNQWLPCLGLQMRSGWHLLSGMLS